MNYIYTLLITLSISLGLSCTIGVAYDSNNRPIIWKNRDVSSCCKELLGCENENTSDNRSNRLYLKDNESHHDILSITTSGKNYRYMGLNSEGFGIVNSIVDFDDTILDLNREEDRDIYSIITEDDLITYSLLNCTTVEDFYNLLMNLESDILYNLQGNDRITCNLAVLDGKGNGGMFEVYFDKDDKIFDYKMLNQGTPYIVRANHYVLLSRFNPDLSSTTENRFDKAKVSDAILKKTKIKMKIDSERIGWTNTKKSVENIVT